MNQADAFVQAILDDPDDDSLRLIYADWLEERGDPRGEFIRVQYALADLDIHDPRRPSLEARERTLLRDNGANWAGLLPRLVDHFTFRRGFVDEVTLGMRAFLEEIGPELSSLAPVRIVRLSGGTGSISSLANAPHLADVRGLDLRFLRLNAAAVGSVLGSPYLDR